MNTNCFAALLLLQFRGLIRQRVVVLLGLAVTAMGLHQSCAAQDLLEWNNAAGGFYDVGSNWTPVGPPTSIDAAQFLLDATYNVQWDSLTASITPNVGFVDVGNGQVTFQNQTSTQHSFTINEDLTLFGGGSLANSGLNLNVGGSTFIIGNSLLVIDGTDPASSQFNASGPVLVAEGSLTFSGGATGSLDTVQVNVDSNGPANMSILGGSLVSANEFDIGNGGSQTAGSSGSLIIDGSDSRLTLSSTGSLTVGNSAGLGSHQLSISAGLLQSSSAEINIQQSGSVNVTSGGRINSFGDLFMNGSLNVLSGGVVSTSETVIGSTSSSNGTVTINGSGSRLTGSLDVGGNGDGTLDIEAGGVASGFNIAVGLGVGSSGVATVTGLGSQLNASNTLNIGTFGVGTLNIEVGGVVNSDFSQIAAGGGSTGTVNVSGTGSLWNSSGLTVGAVGAGTLNIDSGGLVNSNSATLGSSDFTSPVSSGLVNVSGTGSQWSIAGSLKVGRNGQGTLNISDSGRVTVNGSTQINSQSHVNLSGGRFEFGSTSYDEFTRINGTGGSMSGNVNISGINNLASLPELQNPLVDLTEVSLSNSGLLIGSQIIRSSLSNLSSGELLTTAGQQAIFAGSLNNAGEINNTGGTVRFEKSALNQAGGFVGGRGVFGAGEGWTNEGVMAFSGTTEILGDVGNQAGGQFVVSGGATLTLFDDVVHNGAEIRTSAGSQTVFFGEVTGGGDFTGTGTVFFEGDLRPGNSPDIVSFEGDVVLGTGANSYFELAGLDTGLFDQLLIGGDLALNGSLSVSLLDGFQLTDGNEFLIADVGGGLTGQFLGLGEGDLVGRFGNTDLFISYTAGSGNDVGLFASAVPEPGSLNLLGLACLGWALRRRRNR